MIVDRFSLFSYVVCCLHFVAAIHSSEEVKNIREVSTVNSFSTRSQTNVADIPEGWFLSEWPNDNIKLGQVSGVTVDQNENVYIFHRGDRVWSMNTFNIINNIYKERALGPIAAPTILVFHSNGTLLRTWGSRMFYMPHGITVDKDNNVWVTDVALHQVMKFPPLSNNSLFVLGEPFIPGRDSRHFCKPTAVAVLTNGDFFVADGYCNSRILKFNSAGIKILEWGRSTVYSEQLNYYTNTKRLKSGELNVPHALVLDEDKELVCVADRENGRVQCFNVNNGSYVSEMSSPITGSRLFSVTYSPANGGLFFIVNGPEPKPDSGYFSGYVLAPSGKCLARFGSNLKNPHDVAVTSSGNIIYVAEISPFKVWRYVRNENTTTHLYPSVKANPYVDINVKQNIGGLAGAVLVTGACVIFAVAIIIAAFIYSQSKRSGCGHCKSNRWLLHNGTAEGFKLGNILGHQGFEKLNTGEESDEEQPLA